MNKLDDFLNESNGPFAKKTAIIASEGQITYEDLTMQAGKVTKFLQKNGIKKGDRVAILLDNCIEAIAIFYGCLKAGAVASIISPKTPQKIIEYTVSDLNPKVAFTNMIDERFLFQKLEHVVYITEKSILKNSTNYSDIISEYDIGNMSKANVLSVDLACIIYTSGSTGHPKGVMLSHRNMIAAVESLTQYLNYKSDDVVLNVLPFSFDYGLYQALLTIANKGTLILEKSFLWPPLVLKLIHHHKVTVLPLVSTMVGMLYKSLNDQFDISSVRKITNTGIRLTEDHINTLNLMFPWAETYSMYGLTECKRCSYVPPTKLLKKPNSIGIPIPNSEMYIVDSEMNFQPPNTVGQIVVRSEMIMLGYWGSLSETNMKIKNGTYLGDRFLCTGDYGYYDEEGYFYFERRHDDMVKIRGYKVNLEYVEQIIRKCSSILEASVISYTRTDGVEKLYAFCVFKELSTSPNKSKLLEFCKIHLHSHEIPEKIIELNELPLNARGKIDKKELFRYIKE